MTRVGFIGVGIMGSSMVRNLMKDGHEVHIYARNKEKVEQVIADGAVFHDTIAELSVSYTHLDVYKRQVQISQEPAQPKEQTYTQADTDRLFQYR